jgi:hypothetical protein
MGSKNTRTSRYLLIKETRHELLIAIVIIILLVLRRALEIRHNSLTACRVVWPPAFAPHGFDLYLEA